jgi:iduronate 2-sulfatase
MTPYTMNVYGELRNFYGIPKGNDPVPDEQARHLIHGYYACVSFVDAQVGHLMEGLAMFKLRGKTIVILWGDNGLKLGEHGSWSKHTNFEIDTRVPLIVSVPGMKVAGKYTKALVESVDVYPTLCELCGLDLPKQPLEGISFAPILAEPGLKWKKAAFSLNPRGAGIIGIAMRTGRFRYIEWKNQKAGKVLARELYDHDIDPLENVNVSADPSYGGAIKEIEQMMKRGWEGALP